MPIRFRCAYCNQLLGIARRKAGTVVRCPNCAGQVVVPTLEEAGLADGPQPPVMHGGQLFEGNEIDRMLEGAAGDQPSALDIPPPRLPSPALPPAPAAVAPMPMPVPMPGAMPKPAAAPPGFSPAMAPGAAGTGIYLSPSRATLLSVIAVVALAIAFGLGLLVGLFLQSTR